MRTNTQCSCRTFAAVGVDPAIMGIGPAVAIPAAVKSAGLELEDIDLFEINEVIYINSSALHLIRFVQLLNYGSCLGIRITICLLP